MVVKSIYKNEYNVHSSLREGLYNVDKFTGKKQIKLLSLFRGEIENLHVVAIIFHRRNCNVHV
jgi:hypothetical protein